MNDFNELINKLYSEKLAVVAINKADANLHSRFISYMKQKYDCFLEKVNANPQIKQRIFEDWYQTELRHWGNLSDNAKYAHFTNDAALVEIDECSSLIFSIARNKYQSESVNDDDIQIMKNCMSKMTLLLTSVLSENKNTAQKLISEAVVDYNYACGVSKKLSMRLSNLSRYLTKEGK